MSKKKQIDYESNERKLAKIVQASKIRELKLRSKLSRKARTIPMVEFSTGEEDDLGYVPYKVARDWLIERNYKQAKSKKDVSKVKGVYVLCDKAWGVLYVGQSLDIKSRIGSPDHPYRGCQLQFGLTPDLFVKRVNDRLFEECLLIGCLRPKWNFGNMPEDVARRLVRQQDTL